MNKRKKEILISNILVTVLCLGMVALLALSSEAGSSLLSPGQSRILAGDSFDFTLNLGSIDSDSDETEVDGTVSEYVVSLGVSPTISALSVKEGVGSVNVVSGEYQVNSSALDGNTTLHFTVTPASDITSETTYTVSVSVNGDSVSESDSFSFTVVPAASEENPGQGNQEAQGNGGMPGKSAPGGSMKASGSSSTASNLIYAGSWDNYLDSLSVDGYEFTQSFNKTRDTYFVTVPADVTSLTVRASASDSSATVAVAGNRELTGERCKIMVNVTADDGSVRVYRIYVDRKDASETKAVQQGEHAAEETND